MNRIVGVKMRNQQIEKRKVGEYGVIGDLTFDSVIEVEKEGFDAIAESDGQLVLNLAEVKSCSSAALALLLSWLRYAQKQDKRLQFKDTPPILLALIKGAELQVILGV